MNIVSRNFIFVSLLTIVVSFCSIVYELVYSQALTVLYGETVARYSITIGLYLLSLGAGAFFYNLISPKNNPLFFWWNEIALSIVGPLGVVFLFFLGAFNLSLDTPMRAPALFLSHVPVVVVGVLSGFELPLLVGFLADEEKNRFAKILGLDYVGSFIGTLVYSLFLYPACGLVATAIWVGFLNFVATALYTFWKMPSKWLKLLVTLLLVLYGALLYFSDDIQNSVEKSYRGSEIRRLFMKDAEVKGTAVKSVRVNESFSTPYQDVVLYNVIFQNGESDYCLNLDSNIQICDSWLKLYHSGLVDIPMLFFPEKPIKVLVIGGGDWIGIQYLLKYPNVSVIDHVDIDEKFFNFMKTQPYFEKFHGHAYRDPKVHTHVDDAFNFLRRNREKYDLVIVDIPGITHDKLAHLYSTEFYLFIGRSLSDEGLVVLWDYHPLGPARKHYEVLMNTLREAGFKYHAVYDTLSLPNNRFRSSQPFYLVSKMSRLEPSAFGNQTVSLSWIEIPEFEGVRPNTVIKPNYDIVLH